MQNAIPIALISLVVLFSGCASNPAPLEPDWINGNSAQYPNVHYLVGRGQSDRAAVARDRARADLAKIFQVNIAEQSEDTIKHTRQENAGIALDSLRSETSRNIISRTEQTLTDIQIAELWQNPTSKQFHALATLDRLKAGVSLRSEIQQMDKMVSKSIAEAKQQNDLLNKIGAATRAVEQQLVRRELQRQLKVVDVSGMGLSSRQDLSELVQDRDRLLKRLRVSSLISNDPVGGLDDVIAGALSHAGFLNESHQPNYQLNASLTLSDFRDDQGWFWYRGTLEIGLNQLPSNRNRGTHRWKVKVAAQQNSVAARRVLDDLEKQLKKELRQVIIGFAYPK